MTATLVLVAKRFGLGYLFGKNEVGRRILNTKDVIPVVKLTIAKGIQGKQVETFSFL